MNKPSNTPFQWSSEDVSFKNSTSKIKFGTNSAKVSLTGEEIITTADREYGCLRAKHLLTPFPMKNKPIDTVALSAKLEAEHRMSRRSITSNKSIKPVAIPEKHYDQLGEYCEFSKQRKLFDKGEFTICMGHKLGDDFHPLKGAKMLERKKYESKFEEMAAIYLAQQQSGQSHSRDGSL